MIVAVNRSIEANGLVLIFIREWRFLLETIRTHLRNDMLPHTLG